MHNELNFSGGPGALPDTVLRQVQEAILAVPDVGLSIMGISHRSDWFASIIAELKSQLRTLMGLPDDYRLLFLQGGATQQFSMVPMTLLHKARHPAQYIKTGYWSGKCIAEAQLAGPIETIWNGADSGYSRLPTDAELGFSQDAPYFHYVSNETVEGLQFHRIVGRDDVPRVCDMSSDFLSRPCAFDRFDLIYAHAQKNLGPAGVTIVAVRDSVLRNAPDNLPGFLDYRKQIEADSIFNTPPVFAIYVVLLTLRWLRDIGGLPEMERINSAKAALLYRVLDDSDGFYRTRIAQTDRSMMNVTFNLATPELERQFLAASHAAGFSGLEGHRSVGGIRASLYNGITLPAVEKLANFMGDFRKGR
jgi:phosphoserine aminotransferase